MPNSAETGLGFAAKLKHIDEVPEPLRSTVTRALGPGDNIRCLIFGPIQRVVKGGLPASVVAILDDEWIIAVWQQGSQPEIHRCNFAATLLAELTEILLYGRLRLDFVEHGHAATIDVYFNTVTARLYREALELLLGGIGQGGNRSGGAGGESDLSVGALPLKFRNGIRRYLPAADNVLGLVHWPSVLERRWLLLWRECVSQGVLVLTDTQLLLIAEEKAWWPGKSSRDAKYGYVVTYCPRSRLTSIRLREHNTYSAIDVELCAQHFRTDLKIDFPNESKAAVDAFIKTIMPSQIGCD